MGLFSRLFGRGQATQARSRQRLTTVDHPFRIDTPRIGFLNLRGPGGQAIAQADRQALSPFFAIVARAMNSCRNAMCSSSIVTSMPTVESFTDARASEI